MPTLALLWSLLLSLSSWFLLGEVAMAFHPVPGNHRSRVPTDTTQTSTPTTRGKRERRSDGV